FSTCFSTAVTRFCFRAVSHNATINFVYVSNSSGVNFLSNQGNMIRSSSSAILVVSIASASLIKGEDFKSVIEKFCKVKAEKVDIPKPDKWENAGEVLGDNYSIAWRVLDAQYWGVPQRRKRIFLVADFNGRSASKILFESESLRGYFTQSKT